LRMRKAIRQDYKPHEFKHAKHELAQLLTVERERQIAQGASDAPSPTAEAPAAPVSSEPEQE
jgi:large subunit ribosomal protein L29